MEDTLKMKTPMIQGFSQNNTTKAVIIYGSPDRESYSYALADTYMDSLRRDGVQVVPLKLAEMDFDPILHFGYRRRMEEEQDLQMAREVIRQADHLAFFYPIWWGTMPALLKGFVERIFTPGFAFKYRDDNPFPQKLLKNKSARVVHTMDAPVIYNTLRYMNASNILVKDVFLNLCGISPVKITGIGNMKNKDEKFRKKMLDKIYRIGMKDAVKLNQNV